MLHDACAGNRRGFSNRSQTDGLLFEGDCSRCGSVAGIAADIVVTIALNLGAIGRLPARAVAGDRRLSHANYGGRLIGGNSDRIGAGY